MATGISISDELVMQARIRGKFLSALLTNR